MQKNFEELVLIGEFDAAKVAIKSLDDSEVMQEILYVACKTRNLSAYGFVINELVKDESANWHYLASEMLLAPLSIIEGAYALGVFHARKAIKLEPNNIEHKKLLLAFFTLPEPAISKEEAVQLAKEILLYESTNQRAIAMLKQVADED